MCVPDHPEIRWVEQTGYPSWNQPEPIICDCCCDEIDGDVYSTDNYEFLCEKCLLTLCKKEW